MTFTFDTGMLIALERRKRRATDAFRNIVRRGFLPIVPAVVFVEWWRGRTDVREAIPAAVIVEDMPSALCRAAGEALAGTRGISLADAVVMASAAPSRWRNRLHVRSLRSRTSATSLPEGSPPPGVRDRVGRERRGGLAVTGRAAARPRGSSSVTSRGG
jgi:hypothetical protein